MGAMTAYFLTKPATTTRSAGATEPLKTSMENASPAKTSNQDDAFAIKERKKEALLEKARRRYLSLHPEFEHERKDKTL